MTIHYAREEVPEVLKFTPATATLGSAAAQPDAAQAAMRPLAGFGAGAFMRDGVPVGPGASELTAWRTLPRIRGTVAAISPAGAQAHGRGCGAHQIGAGGTTGVRGSGVASTGRKSAFGIGSISTSNVRTTTVRTSTVGTSSVGTQQFDLMTRISPAAPGGLGPHPAREPEPV